MTPGLNGQKKWIGNATFGDLTVIWAKDVADGQVKGFVVENSSPGFTADKQEHKIALRIVQNALITLDNVRVPEHNRLQGANTFKDTAEVLRLTRAGVAWMAVGCARGAYENALRYACAREQFGRPIGGFQLVQDLLVRMLGNITSSLALCARLSQLQDQGHAEDRHSSLAKAFCTVRMRETVGWARELMGGNGILLEHNVGRFVATRKRSTPTRHQGDEHPDRRTVVDRTQRLRMTPACARDTVPANLRRARTRPT